jgi:hypothetical protein
VVPGSAWPAARCTSSSVAPFSSAVVMKVARMECTEYALRDKPGLSRTEDEAKECLGASSDFAVSDARKQVGASTDATGVP